MQCPEAAHEKSDVAGKMQRDDSPLGCRAFTSPTYETRMMSIEPAARVTITPVHPEHGRPVPESGCALELEVLLRHALQCLDIVPALHQLSRAAMQTLHDTWFQRSGGFITTSRCCCAAASPGACRPAHDSGDADDEASTPSEEEGYATACFTTRLHATANSTPAPAPTYRPRHDHLDQACRPPTRVPFKRHRLTR